MSYNTTRRNVGLWLVCAVVTVVEAGYPSGALGTEPRSTAGSTDLTSAQRGFKWLTTTPLLPPDFDDAVFERLWTVWPKELKNAAKNATPAERRWMAFERYGLVESPDHPGVGPALGYIADGEGGWVMNCLACHNGTLEGKVIWGLPNSHYGLQTLTEEVRLVKLGMGKPLSHLDLGSLKIPLGSTHGTTNAVIFGVALGAKRDRELKFIPNGQTPPLIHHDCDAPPFWNVRKKSTLYADGFAAKGHRPLLQFVMIPQNSRERMEGWEEGAKDLLAWIESLETPRYPHPIDVERAARGKVAFERVCSRCHGTYAEAGSGKEDFFPDKIIPIEEIGTDRLRFEALRREYREFMAQGWFGHFGTKAYRIDTDGYVAPPLDGVWASAPYFHNGSVPTLEEVLTPGERPVVWRRSLDGYDRHRVGLDVERLADVPETVTDIAEKRRYFDTRKPGKNAAGHTYPNELTDGERRDVLEYLKTL